MRKHAVSMSVAVLCGNVGLVQPVRLALPGPVAPEASPPEAKVVRVRFRGASTADDIMDFTTVAPGVKTGEPRGPVHSCKNCAHLAKGSCDEPCAGCTVRWRSGVSDRWEPAYGVPGSEPLRHATTWSGDCPHWCRACAAERARTDGVPDTDGRQE